MDDTAEKIFKGLRENGFQAFLVGGAVRDYLMNSSFEDQDILTNAPPEAVAGIFSACRVRCVGKTFPVCLVDGVEVASHRSGSRRLPFPESDLACRDFTINSMAWDPMKNLLIDPFGGREDLEKGIIRFTGDARARILEDPLRMIRACRFVSLFQGRLAAGTREAILSHAPLVGKRVAFERIRLEILKTMPHPRPSLFFETLADTGLLADILPCLDRLRDLDGGPYHGETVFRHCLLVGDAITPGQPLLRLAGFLHDVGKFDALVLKDGQASFPGHEQHREAMICDLTRLAFSRREIARVDALVRAHMRPLTEDSSPKAVRRLLAFLAEYDVSWRDFMRMRIADKRGNLKKAPYTLSQLKVRVGKLTQELADHASPAFSPGDLAVSGRDVMNILEIPGGPRVGEILDSLFQEVLADPGLNQPHLLKEMILKMGQ